MSQPRFQPSDDRLLLVLKLELYIEFRSRLQTDEYLIVTFIFNYKLVSFLGRAEILAETHVNQIKTDR